MTILHVLLIAVLAIAGLFVFYGREKTWSLVAGPADLGRVEFETLERLKTPNDALVAPRALVRAPVDAEPPVFAVSRDVLRDKVLAILAEEPLAVKVADHAEAFEARWVVRTPLMRYPDTVSVRFLDAGSGRSTLALYSRSQIGRSDFGANRARIDRWLARLSADLPTAQ